MQIRHRVNRVHVKAPTEGFVIIVVKIVKVVIVAIAIHMTRKGYYYGNMDTWISFD